MKTNFLILFIFICTRVNAQVDSNIIVSGTKCSIIPPKGFTTAVGFSGFQLPETGASIIVMEMPTSYANISSTMNRSTLKAQGMKVKERQTIDFNGQEATLLYVKHKSGKTIYYKQILIFGDSSIAIMVNGMCPKYLKYLEPEIKQSIFSIQYNSNQNLSGEEEAEFKIDTNKTDLKFAAYLQGSLIYTADGKMPIESDDKSMLIVGTSFQNVPIENRKEYCEKRIKSLPYGEKNMVEKIDPITINNLEGFELMAYGYNKEKNKQLVYQVILFTETDSYFIILAWTEADFEENLLDFKEVARTFVRK